jgi:serine/threonine-protein kinase
MSALTTEDLIGGTWRIVRPALGDEPGSEFRVEPAEGGEPRRLTLWRTLRAPTRAELKSFEQHVRAGEGLESPCLPPVEAVGFDAARESLWLVREWQRGESLPSALGGLQPIGLDLPILDTLAEQLAQVLTTAHAEGLVHGRLRPSRLLVAHTARGERLSLLDLGLETFRREHGQDWLRSPQLGASYLAPESRRPGRLSPAVDVFAFGLIVRDMLVTRKDGTWRGRWEPWVERATADNPRERFGDLPEALRALRPVLATLPGLRPPPPSNHDGEGTVLESLD